MRLPLILVCSLILPASAQKTLPKTWIDADTHHRVFRVTDEPNSAALYFNFDAYTPDGRQMVYSTPTAVYMLSLDTMKTRQLFPTEGAQRIIGVGRKTGAVFFTRTVAKVSTMFSADPNTGAITKLTTLPVGASVVTVNADETLASGTFVQGEAPAPAFQAAPIGNPGGSLVQPAGKGQMMARRLAQHLPMVLFVVDLHSGKLTELQHSTEWINHMLFSPVDPTLLMYCHEGPWQLVDRIWLIRTDGTQNTLVHKRTMFMEISGHEFWSRDGKSIWYDWQFPKGQTYFLAGYDIATHHREAYSMTPNQWSIHFNGSLTPDVFIGDGGDAGQVTQAPDGTWVELYHATTPGRRDGVNDPSLIQPGVLANEHLVNMANHNYKLEPNERFSPDDKLIFFTSNMFGPAYVFAVEVARTDNPAPGELQSTPALAQQFSPKPPPTPYSEQW